MKKVYIKPQLEVFKYQPEKGYNASTAMYTDYILVEGNERDVMRTAQEVTEYTDDQGEYEIGLWE